jgi:flagellar motor switch protein FliN/FliY
MNTADLDTPSVNGSSADATDQSISSPMDDTTTPPNDTVAAQAPQLTDFEQTTLGNAEVPIGMLLDLTLPVAIELGRTSMTVEEILRLGRGSVMQLDRLAGEPIDIYVGDRRFAEGEVVVLGEHFGVRLTRVLSNQSASNAAHVA